MGQKGYWKRGCIIWLTKSVEEREKLVGISLILRCKSYLLWRKANGGKRMWDDKPNLPLPGENL